MGAEHTNWRAAPRHAHGRARGRIVSRGWSRGSAWRCVPGACSMRARTRCHARPVRLRSGLTPAGATPTRSRRGPRGGAHPLGVDVDRKLAEARAKRAVSRAGLAAVMGLETKSRLPQREGQGHGNPRRTCSSGKALLLRSEELRVVASAADRSASGRRHRHGGEAPCSPRSWRRSSRAALDPARAPPVCRPRQTGSERCLVRWLGGSRVLRPILVVSVILISIYLY